MLLKLVLFILFLDVIILGFLIRKARGRGRKSGEEER